MGANVTQAVGLLLFLMAFVALAMALAGAGVLVAVLGVALLGGSAAVFMQCKPLEHGE